jgi:hypothetical protein
MKIETRNMAPDPAPVSRQRALWGRGLYARAGLAVVGAAAMLGALRWAVITTADNERQVASTLTTLQSKIETPATDPAPFADARLGKMKAHRTRTKGAAGPTIEPTDKR